MLTPPDDTLWHQLPTTFDHVGTSDPRFFDRYWFACYAPDGTAGVQLTMGAYRNMNVLDGGAAVLLNARQYNVRMSRALDRSAESQGGPLTVQPIVPLKEHRLLVGEGPHPLRGEITWRAIAEPFEEHPHFERLRGRVVQEYVRFAQVGVAEGWVDVDGRRVTIDQWWACRDHSWGVRRGMAVREPVTGPKASLEEKGHVQVFLYFATDRFSGTVHMLRRGDDEPYFTGKITARDAAEGVTVDDVVLDLEFFPDTRRFRTAQLEVHLSDGTTLLIDSEARGSAFAMPGIGYSGGYHDGKGPGVWRGESHLETDVWDVSDPAVVVDGEGNSSTPWHRIQPVGVSVTSADGVSPGSGSMTLTVSGRLPAYLDKQVPRETRDNPGTPSGGS